MMIDTHCHLDKDDYDNLDEVIKKMENNIIIASSIDIKTTNEILNLCTKYNNIFCTIGIHPEFATLDSKIIDSEIDYIEKNLSDKHVVGIGEIGLDYHYDNYDKDKQLKLFKKQLNLARKYNKTVVIHTRDAINETYEILKEYPDIKKVIHCYSGSLEMAKKFIDINCMLGIGGVLTFKNSEKLKNVVKTIDLEHLLLETDSPYLTPEPFRGKKNQPYNIIYVAKKIAELKEEDLEHVLSQTTENAIAQFDLKITM